MTRIEGDQIIDSTYPAPVHVLLDGKLIGYVERVNPGLHYVDVWEQWTPPLESKAKPIWQLVHKTGYVIVYPMLTMGLMG